MLSAAHWPVNDALLASKPVRSKLSDQVKTEFGALTFKHLLLPVWMLAYRYRRKAFQVTVNGVSGEVQGERPWSVAKILGLVALALALAAAAFFAFAGSR